MAWALTAAALFAFWLLLVDTHAEAQVLVGLGVAMLAASISELVRRQRIAKVRVRPRWLARLWRPPASVPRDLLRLAIAAVPGRHPTSRLRALPFDQRVADSTDNGRQALAELAGSFSPNTIVIGVDVERGLVERAPVRLRRAGEAALQPLEAAQSGHPGDYVAWLTAGAGALCAVLVLTLR